MNELDFNPTKKSFTVNGTKIEKNVVLERFVAYNKNGNETIEVLQSFPENITVLYDYDIYGNQIHSRASPGAEFWHKFDDYGHEIYMKTEQGDEVIFEYDDAGNCIYSRSSRGFESQYRYNEKNQKIFEYNSRFNEITLFQYDKNNQLIRSIDSDGNVTKYNYDSSGNLSIKVSSYGSIEYYEYDTKGNILYSVKAEIDDDIDVEDFKLDLNLLEDKEELFYEYEYYPEGKVQKMYIYGLSEK